MEEQTTTEVEAEAETRPGSLDEALGSGELIDEIQASLSDGGPEAPASGPAVAPLPLDQLGGRPADGESVRDLDLLSEVDVEVSVEFGRVAIPIRQLLKLRRGSLVELARRPEQQVTVLANGKPIAYGDIVVVDDQVGVHIVELIDPDAPPEAVPPPAQVEMAEPEPQPEAAEVSADEDALGDGDG